MRNLILACLFAIGCATGDAEPKLLDVSVESTGPVFFGSSTTAPVHLEVVVTNRGAAPIQLRNVRLTSPGMVQYALRPESRMYNETIGAGESKAYSIVATLIAAQARLTPTEPLTIRADLDFESGGTRKREIFHISRVGM